MPTSLPFYRIAPAALFLALGLPSWASPPITLAEALETAVGRSQQMAAQNAVITSAREKAVSAAQLPDPVLKLGVDNLPVNGEDRFNLANDFMTMRRIGVMQELPHAQKRQLRAERFERDVQRAEAERHMALATVRRSTAIAWLDLYYAQAMLGLVQLQLGETQLQVQAAETAYGSGRGYQGDAFAARAALLMLEDRISQSDRQVRSASIVLTRWVGSDGERAPSGPPPWQNTPLESALTLEHLRLHPEIQILAAKIEAARTDVRLAEANRRADWTFEANYSQRGARYSNMLSFGVSIPLQVDRKNRQDREVADKLALVVEAQARLDDMLREQDSVVRGLLNDWRNGKQRVARYHEKLIPTAQQRSQVAVINYRSGKGDIAAALSARRDEIDVRIQALALEQDTARLWAQLHYLIPNTNPLANLRELP